MGNPVRKSKATFPFFANNEGLNLAGSLYNHAEGQARESNNIKYVKSGGFKARGGQDKVNATLPVSNPRLLFGLEYRREIAGVQVQKKICWGDDGKIYDYSTDPPTSIKTLGTINKMPDAFVARGFLFFVDGNNTPQKWEPTNGWSDWGISAPTVAPTAATGGAGSPNGTYRFRLAFRRSVNSLSNLDPGHASSMGEISASVSATNQEIDLTNLQVSSDAQVDEKDVLVEIGGVWYVTATIPNANTTYTYDELDSNSVLGELGRLDRDKPPTGLIYVEQHDNVIYGSDGKKLYWTLFDEPESWSEIDRQSNAFGTDDGTKITGLRSFESLIVSKERSIFVRDGNDVEYTIDEKITNSGVVARNSMVVKDGSMYYLAHDGFRMFNGSDSSLISNNMSSLLFGSSNEKIIYSDLISLVSGTDYTEDEVKTIIWSLPTSATQFTKALVFYPEYKTRDVTNPSSRRAVGSFNVWDNLDSSFIFKGLNLSTQQDELFSAGTSGQLTELNTGYTETDGSDIECSFRPVDYFFGAPAQYKRLRDIFFIIEMDEGIAAPATPPVVEFFTNGISSGIQRNLTFYDSGAVFDTAIFDTDRFAAEGTFIGDVAMGHNPFRTISPKISWSVGEQAEDITWIGWVVRVIPGAHRRLVRA